MSWNTLNNLAQIEQIKIESQEKPVLIFKHSTRCSISSMAWDRIKRNWKPEDSEKISPYYLDLIAYRPVSNAIAELFAVDHQSPQVLLIKNGIVVYDNSHMGISYADIMTKV